MTTRGIIDTEDYSQRLRVRAIDVGAKKILVTNFRNTEQEEDLTLPPNCDGYGRVRHFLRATSPGWPANPLPLDPARRALSLPRSDEMLAQVFQNAACNWRCWYCYVPFPLLAANLDTSAWLTADQLVRLYISEPVRPSIIDLTGGQPDLVPEWIPWMMEALTTHGLEGSTYLWSDDNLSTDYFTRFLSNETREYIAGYPSYGRVCCFKGYDSESFSFNTRAAPELFNRQFELFTSLLEEGLDLYAYVTFTSPTSNRIKAEMPRFVDKLQEVHPNLPLRTVPLEIQSYTPMIDRMSEVHRQAIRNQWDACEAWQTELETRFSGEERNMPITRTILTSTTS